MVKDSFSGKYGYAPERGDLIYEDVPQQVRVGLVEILAKCGYDTLTSQQTVLCKTLRIRPESNAYSGYYVKKQVDSIVYDQVWFKFYDMCERIAQNLATSPFEEEFNKLLQEERVGYHMQQGRLERVGSKEFEQAASEARIELGDTRFSVASQQFEKALAFRNSMPPDYSNAVKEAVNALEGTLQVICDRPGTALPTTLSSLQPSLPSSLKKLYDGLYAYGSASEGARHAGVGGPLPGAEEVELTIHAVAAAIRYVIKTYS